VEQPKVNLGLHSKEQITVARLSEDISESVEDVGGNVNVGWADGFPSFRKQYEKNLYDSLKTLYTEPFKFKWKEITVGGRSRRLDSFHYVDTQNECKLEYNNKRIRKFEFIDKNEIVTFIYRWEIKACLITALKAAEGKFFERVFHSFARYGSNVTSKQFDCCAVLIIRCVNRTPVFLMTEVSTDPSIENDIQKWEGYDQIKSFYCMPEVSVDYDKLSFMRERYWKSNRHIYKDDKFILIDTHRPGDQAEGTATAAQVEQKFKLWSIKEGPRDVIADAVVAKGNKESICEVRKGFLKDKAETVAKDKKISELELTIEKLNKSIEQKSKVAATPLPAKQSPVVPTPEISVVGKKRPLTESAVSSSSSSSNSPFHVAPQYFQYSHPPSSYNFHNPNFTCSAAVSIDNNTIIHQQQKLAEERNKKDHDNALEIKKRDHANALKEKRVKELELEVEASRKELALRACEHETKIAKAKADLELQTINRDKREREHAMQKRQEFLHDQDNAIRYQQQTEDRLFHQESIKRRWAVEDRNREDENRRNHYRDIMDITSRSNENNIIHAILNAQRPNYQVHPPQFPPNPLITQPLHQQPPAQGVPYYSQYSQPNPPMPVPTISTHPFHQQTPIMQAAQYYPQYAQSNPPMPVPKTTPPPPLHQQTDAVPVVQYYPQYPPPMPMPVSTTSMVQHYSPAVMNSVPATTPNISYEPPAKQGTPTYTLLPPPYVFKQEISQSNTSVTPVADDNVVDEINCFDNMCQEQLLEKLRLAQQALEAEKKREIQEE
jgi:hypothetical protein